MGQQEEIDRLLEELPELVMPTDYLPNPHYSLIQQIDDLSIPISERLRRGAMSNTKIVVLHDSRADIANNLHTALRKHCDSKITSVAWNLFHIVSDNTLDWFYSLVEGAAKGVAFDSTEALIRAIKERVVFDDDWPGKPERAAIHTTLMLFDERDWGAYVSLLYQEIPVLPVGVVAIDRGPLGGILEGIAQAYKEPALDSNED